MFHLRSEGIGLVSVVIPTRNRPAIVARAVRSVFAQTYPHLEVIVVVDGPDLATVEALEALGESRLRVVALDENVGGSEARNIGVREAMGEWVALLDDDDEWFPEKIEKQVTFANSLEDKNVFVSCRFLDQSLGPNIVSPLRLPDQDEPIDEYFCCPKQFRAGEGFLQTSTLFIRRELILQVPFVQGLKRGQEFSWMLSACAYGGASYFVLPDVLSIFHSESGLGRVSKRPNWRSFYAWMEANKQCFSPRSYSFYIATGVLHDAIACNEPYRIRIQLGWHCVTRGTPTLKCLVKLLYLLVLPPRLRTILNSTLRPIPKKSSIAARSSANIT